MTLRTTALALAFSFVSSAALAEPRGNDPIQYLFPPELVMRSQSEVGITDAQRRDITAAIQETQGKVVEIKWELENEQRKLVEILDHERVDSNAAIAQVERVLALEARVKKAHIGLLVRIKNGLTAEQQQRLQALRPDPLAWLLDTDVP